MATIYLQNVVSGSWANFGELISPVALSKTLKDNIASDTVNVFFEGTDVSTGLLLPGTIVRIIVGTTAHEYYVVEDASKSGSSTIDPFCIHTYKISELLAYTREIYIQTSFFSNGEYTMPEFFTRLFALCKSDVTLTFEAGYDYATALANWQSPDYQVASNSLLDNLFKIGKMLGVRFKAQYDETNEEVQLYCINLKGTTTATSLGTYKNGSLEQYKASNYASKVVANVENMASDSEQWFPENDTIYGVTAEPDNDANGISSLDELVLVLPHPIRSASELRVMGFLDTTYFASYTIYDKNDDVELCNDLTSYNAFIATLTAATQVANYYRNITGVPIIYKIYEYSEWLQLDPDAAYNSATYHQENTLYYKRGENKIFNIGICTGVADPLAEYPGDPIYYQLYLGNHEPVYQELSPAYNFYSVKCNLYVDGQIVEKNTMGSERIALYSQEENLASGRSLVSNMQGYVGSMTNSDDTMIYLHDAYTTIPTLGQLYSGQVIHSINYEMEYESFKVQYELSDDLVPKSEFVSQDGGLLLPDITTNKVYDRYTNYSTTLWFCRTLANAEAILAAMGADTFAQASFITYAIDSLSNGRTNKGMIPAEVLVRTGEYETDENHTALDLSAKAVHTALLITWRTRDNLSCGTYFDDASSSTITDYVYLPVAFINADGDSNYITYKILADSVRATEANYPAIAEATFDNSTAMILIDDELYYHDHAERINGIFQANFKAYSPGDRVFQTFLDESSLMNDTLNVTDEYTRYVKIGSTNFTVYSINTTTPSAGIRKKAIVFTPDETITTGNSYACTFLRIKDGTSVEEKMLETTCTISDAALGKKSADFYVAFTK